MGNVCIGATGHDLSANGADITTAPNAIHPSLQLLLIFISLKTCAEKLLLNPGSTIRVRLLEQKMAQQCLLRLFLIST